jgi:protocatechuate 3,4-dioxygenase beta subunit
MLRLTGLAFMGLATLTAHASAQRDEAASGPYRIAGTVVNASTGTPVQRASLEILSAENSRVIAATVSGSDGRFAFERLATGKYPLMASKRGYNTALYNQHEGYNSAIVTGPDQDTEHIIFLLWPGAEVHGMVTADGGDLVEDARVMLFRRTNHQAPNEQMVMAGAAVTDDTGFYEIGDQEPGEYTVAVVARPWYAMHATNGKPAGESNAALDVAYPITYFDSTSDESAATVLKLTSGAHEEANISLHAVPALHISVTMPRREDGRLSSPELRQYVFGQDVGTNVAARGSLNGTQSGTAEFDGIAPGHYELRQGDPPRKLELDATSSELIDPDAGTPSVVVSGRVQMAGGPGALRHAWVTLTPVNGTRGHTQRAFVGPDTRFTFEAVDRGTWALSADADGARVLPARSIASGANAHEGNLLTVTDHSLDIVATITSKAIRIEGFAQKNRKGLAGALVLLAPRDTAEFETLSRRDQSDSDGSFALNQVIPGRYTLIAIEGGWDLDLSRPEVLARYLPQGTPVLVTDASGEVMHLTDSIAVQPR